MRLPDKIRRHRKRLGLTQAELAERSGLSEAAMRSYELGNRVPKPAHRQAMAKALGINPKSLLNSIGRDVEGTIQTLMDMESEGMIRPVLIGGVAYLMPCHADMESGVQEWAERQFEYATLSLGHDDYEDWKDGYSQPGAQGRTREDAVNRHFDFAKAAMGERLLEEELAKMPLESDREAFRRALGYSKVEHCGSLQDVETCKRVDGGAGFKANMHNWLEEG